MMKLIVQPSCRTLVNNAKELQVEANSIGELIEKLDRQYPGFSENVLKHSRTEIRDSVTFDLVKQVQSKPYRRRLFSRNYPRVTYYESRGSIHDLEQQLPDGAIVRFSLRNIAGG